MVNLESTIQEKQQLVSPDDASKKLHDTNMRLVEESHNRLNAMDELRESREMYRRFFQTARDAVFIAAVDGRWIDMNESALILFGYDQREEIWTDTMLNFYWDSDQGKEYVQKLKTDGYVKDYPLKFRKRNGSSFNGLISAAPYEIGGKLIGYQGFIRDITDELRVKEENEKLHKNQLALDSLALETGKMLSPDEIYASISNHFKDLITLDWIRILKFEEKTANFKIEYEWGTNPFITGRALEPEDIERNFQSLIRQIIKTKKTTVASLDSGLSLEFEETTVDMSETDGDDPAYEDLQMATHNMILVPIMIDKQVICIIQLVCDPSWQSSTEDLSLLTMAANTLAICLNKAYLYQQSQIHVKTLSSFQRIQHNILENLSLPTTLDMLVDEIVRELSVDAVDILYFHPGLKSLRPIAQQGFRQKVFQNISIEIGEGLAGKAAKTKSIIHVRDLINSEEQINRSLEFSTEKFVTYFGVPLLVKGRMVGVLEIFNRSVMDPEDDWIDLLKLVAGLAGTAIDLQNLTNDLERSRKEIAVAFDGVIKGWASALELRGIEPKGHAERIVELTEDLARNMGLDGPELEDIRRGVLLHDIGKMGIPDEVLLKGSVLNEVERKKIGRHPVDAYELLKSVDALKSALDIPLYHHERWDGEGYPYQIEGEDIPLAARMFAIVDVWDAMLSDRPYRKAYSREEAIQHIKQQSGKHFDPVVVKAFLKLIEDVQNE